MLFLHEVHEVIGRSEDEFEAAIRDEWMPRLARTAGSRLLYFLHHAHGSGASYRVVTITAIRDGAAWGELVREVADGSLRPLAESLDRLRHDLRAKMLIPLPWSPIQQLELDAVPSDARPHELSIFMEVTSVVTVATGVPLLSLDVLVSTLEGCGAGVGRPLTAAT